MLDLIRNSEVPSHLMQSAARGSLSLPPGETIEILVYLALHHKLFGPQARLTLAGWDEKASLAAAADPTTSVEVLGYFVSRENLRPSLLPALAENPSVSEESLDQLAVAGSRSIVETLIASARVMSSPRLLQALQANADLNPRERAEIEKKLAALGVSSAAEPTEAAATDEAIENTVTRYLQENAAELAADPDKPFHDIGMTRGMTGEDASGEAGEIVPNAPADAASASADEAGKPAAAATAKSAAAPGRPAASAVTAAAHARKQPHPVHEERRDSTLQKIAKLDIKGRIALAVRGDKEARSILIRDGTKLVALAVLESPKVTDGEVENFAQQKNVLDSVLRAIPMKRRFFKNYNVIRNLAFNPRSPIDLSLGLVKHLLTHDLKNLVENKEVPETIRKTAMRLYRQKMELKAGKSGH
jgi:hypothetical protein